LFSDTIEDWGKKLTVFFDPVWNRPTPASPELLDVEETSWCPVVRIIDSNRRLLPTELLPAKGRH